MDKADGAFLTIGELSRDLGVPQHILRYWESRFPQLRPLQRSGNRRYYRPEDVVIARRIHQLLNVEGFTIKGAIKALAGRPAGREKGDAAASGPVQPVEIRLMSVDQLIDRLRALRAEIAAALDDPANGAPDR